jgi:hypothetical protein
MSRVPKWLAILYVRVTGVPCPFMVNSLCELTEELCLELFPFQEEVQGELVGGPANLCLLRLALLECHRNGEEGLVSLIDGLTSFHWPN